VIERSPRRLTAPELLEMADTDETVTTADLGDLRDRLTTE
jgi:hypothetical protein